MRKLAFDGARPSRRRLLILGASVSALALTGCATIPGQIPAWLQGLQAILEEAPSIIPQLQNFGLSGSALATAQQVVADIEQVLNGIGNATTAAEGLSILQQVETYINTLAPIALAVIPASVLGPAGTVIGLVIAALPAIEAGVNMLVSALSPIAKQIATPAAASRRYRSVFGAAGADLASSQLYLNLLIQRANAKPARRPRR
jgi:hypothetical protein